MASPRSAFLLLLVALAGCATVRVSSDYEHTRDFSAYKSYGWLAAKPVPTGLPTLDTPMVQERIRKGVDAELTGKGFAQVAESPDFWVKYQLTAEKKVDVHTDDDAFMYGATGFEIGVPVTRVSQYDEGTLIIDVFDAKEKKLVWRGIGQGRLRGESAQSDPEKSEQRIREAVAAVLESFPPKPE
jgi:hypothetical protein